MRRLRGETRSLNIDRLEQCVHHGISQLYASFHLDRSHEHGHERERGSYDRHEHGDNSYNSSVVVQRCGNVAERGDRRTLATLVKLLRGAAGGLENLRATYADDIGTVARITAMIDAIDQGLANLSLE